MRKKLCLLMLLLCAVLWAACGKGAVDEVRRATSSSTYYTQEEISAAMDLAVASFAENFAGCALTDLWYDEEYSAAQAGEWSAQYQADQAIVLLSNFDVGPEGGDGSLAPDSTYERWSWVLVRDEGEPWQLKTWGY